jgi:hypothetical protein
MGQNNSGQNIKYKQEDDVIKIYRDDEFQIVVCNEESDFYKYMRHLQSMRRVSDVSRSLDMYAMREATQEDLVNDMGFSQSASEDDIPESSGESDDEENISQKMEQRPFIIDTKKYHTIHSRKEIVKPHSWTDNNEGDFVPSNPTKRWFVIEDEAYYDGYKTMVDIKMHEKISNIHRGDIAQPPTLLHNVVHDIHSPLNSDDLVHNLFLFNESFTSYKKGHQLKDVFDDVCSKLNESVVKFRTNVIGEFVANSK